LVEGGKKVIAPLPLGSIYDYSGIQVLLTCSLIKKRKAANKVGINISMHEQQQLLFHRIQFFFSKDFK